MSLSRSFRGVRRAAFGELSQYEDDGATLDDPREAVATVETRDGSRGTCSAARTRPTVVRCPPEIAWHVLGYWRCQYPADTPFYDQHQLGVH